MLPLTPAATPALSPSLAQDAGRVDVACEEGAGISWRRGRFITEVGPIDVLHGRVCLLRDPQQPRLWLLLLVACRVPWKEEAEEEEEEEEEEEVMAKGIRVRVRRALLNCSHKHACQLLHSAHTHPSSIRIHVCLANR